MQNTWNCTENKLILYVEVSSMCNALCPQCDRYKPGTLTIHDHVTNTYWSLEKFKQVFTPDDLKLVKVFNFAGLYGDPATNPNLPSMVDYVIKNSSAWIIIETNGSIKTTEWWYNLGKIGGHRLKVQFDVDGSTQEIHEKYRVNTNLYKVLNNMLAFSKTGCETKVMTILFKHNEDDLSAIKELTKKYGATEWDSTQSLRFYNTHDVYRYTDKQGNEKILETPTVTKRSTSRLRRIRNFSNVKADTIVCPNAEANFLQVDSYGNVWPCCDILEAHERKFENVDYTDEINLLKHSLKDVMKSKWYSSFTTRYKQCDIWCSHKPDTDNNIEILNL